MAQAVARPARRWWLPLVAAVVLLSLVGLWVWRGQQPRYQGASESRADLPQLKRDQEWGSKSSTAAALTATRSLAVLPFANLSADKENEYFSDGLAEEIINSLTLLPGLRVIARTSSFSFRGKEVDVREIGSRLKVENILEGSVRKVGNQIRVTVQLVHAGEGYQLWSQRYDRKMTDVFAIQDEICRAIVDKLRVELAAASPLVKRYTENVEAYNLYLKAHYQLFKFTPESMAKSKEYYEQAIALDPNYARAWVGLTSYYTNMGFFGFLPPNEARAGQSRTVQKALELDDKLAEGHGIMGVIQSYDFNWKGAEREFRRALELDPRSEDVWAMYDFNYLVPMRRLDEAVAASRRALELDPLSPFLQWRLGYRYFLKREYDRAIQQCRNALELDPTYFPAHVFLGLSYAQTGKSDEAIRVLEKLKQLTGGSPMTLGYLGQVYAMAGRKSEARKLLGQLQDLAKKTYVPPSCFPGIYYGLGEIETGFQWLEKAADERDALIMHVHLDPTFDPTRNHPRYPALLRKMNLER